MRIELTKAVMVQVLRGNTITYVIYLPIAVFFVLLLVILIVITSICVSENVMINHNAFLFLLF